MVSRRTGRPSEPVLDRQIIVASAVELIDEVDLNGFTIRGLARRLDVTAGSLYHHFKDKDEVLQAVVRYAVQDVRAPRQQPTWQQFLIESMAVLRQVLLRHPNLRPLLAERPWHDWGHVTVERTVKLLDEGGVPPRLQLLILRTSEIVVFGSALLSGSLDYRVYGDVAEEYPYLTRAIAGDTWTEEETFRIVCQAVVTGLTASMLSGNLSDFSGSILGTALDAEPA
jgi:TetR/AcrR family tetracycline transcriptional repressor